MNSTIKYTSKNGYSGVLYGESSMSIYDKRERKCFIPGREMLIHTRSLWILSRIFQTIVGGLKKPCRKSV